MLQAAIKMFLTQTRSNNESSEKHFDQKKDDEIRHISRSWEFVYQRNDHFYECVKKKNSWETTSNVFRRKRVKSCPEFMDLRKLSKSLELAISQLREICEEGTRKLRLSIRQKLSYSQLSWIIGEQFLQDNDSTSSCNDSSCIECLEEETSYRNKIFYNKNRLSMAIDDDDRLVASGNWRVTTNFENYWRYLSSFVRVDELNSLENCFKADVDQLLHLLQSLPDDQQKAEILGASQFYLSWFF